MSDIRLKPILDAIVVQQVLGGEHRIIGFEGSNPAPKPTHVEGYVGQSHEDVLLVRMSAASELMHSLSSKLTQRQSLLTAHLRDEYGLDLSTEAVALTKHQSGVYYDAVSGKEAGEYIFCIPRSDMHDMAMKALEKLAVPRDGAKLLGYEHESDYLEQLKSPDSPASKLLTQIVKNAGLITEDVNKLNEIALRRGNYRFITRMQAIGPSPSQAERSKNSPKTRDGLGG